MNYDFHHKTFLIKQIIYPHRQDYPCWNQDGLFLVKLLLNGVPRCFMVQHAHPSSMSAKGEQYPAIVEKAMRLIYPQLQRVPVLTVIYRLCGWLPEKFMLQETKNPKQSFKKLKSMVEKGEVMMFYQEIGREELHPVFKLTEKDRKQHIQTFDSSFSVVMKDFQEMVRRNELGMIYFSWNPSLYGHRKKLHFTHRLRVGEEVQYDNLARDSPF